MLPSHVPPSLHCGKVYPTKFASTNGSIVDAVNVSWVKGYIVCSNVRV